MSVRNSAYESSIVLTEAARVDLSAILRYIAVDNYPVFYVPTHENRTVTVLRILYGGRDIDRQLAMPKTK